MRRFSSVPRYGGTRNGAMTISPAAFRLHVGPVRHPQFLCWNTVGEVTVTAATGARVRVVGMRVIAGRFKGMALATPKPGTRPTTDRTKEAVFSHLDSWGLVRGASVLDLFAGTGALGIEALSRGAQSLVAVESAGLAAALINGTLTQLKRSKAWRPELSARVMRRRAEVFIDSYHGASFDLVFIDPPYAYATEECNALLEALAQGEATGPDTMIVIERSARSDALTPPAGWHEADARKYGETAVIYLEPDAQDADTNAASPR